MIRLAVIGEDDCIEAAADVPRGEQALAAGKHVLLSASLVSTGDELDRLTGAASAAGRQLAIVNAERLLPSRQLIQRELAAGKLGAPGLVRLHCWEPGAAETSPGLPALLLQQLDVAMWLMGDSPHLVYATRFRSFWQIHFAFRAGGMALLDYSALLPAGESYRSLHVIGSAGAAYADDHQNLQLLFAGGQPRVLKAQESRDENELLLQSFLPGLAAGRDFSDTVREWRCVLAIAGAVRQSLESRQAVSLEGR